jgi:hypothetical protein
VGPAAVTAPAHVPIQRILERVNAMPGVQPRRIFPVLLPMWGVEIQAQFWDAQPYEVFDQYLSRAIGSAGLNEPDRLAAFFGVQPALIERALRFLEAVGHVRRESAAVALTDLGRRSVAAGCRYVVKEDRQLLYFDGFTSAPMLKEHYAGGEWLDEPLLRLSGTQFQPITALARLSLSAIDELAARADRDRFNVPGSLTAIEAREIRQAWLPAYILECTAGLMVFVKAIEGPDAYLADLLTPHLWNVLASEPRPDYVAVWQDWLAGKGFHEAVVRTMSNGVLRASLPASAFGEQVRWAQLGSFVTRDSTFLQIWCEEAAARRQAVLARAAAIVSAGRARTPTEVERWLAELAGQLEVEVLSPDEIP